MKVTTWSNGKVLSITLVKNDNTVLTIKETFDKETINTIDAKVKDLKKEVDADNKKTSTARVNKIIKMFSDIEKTHYAKKEVVKVKIPKEQVKTKKQASKEAKREIASKEQEISKVSDLAKVKKDTIENSKELFTLSITGNDNQELLNNLNKERERLLSLQQKENKPVSSVIHKTRGEY